MSGYLSAAYILITVGVFGGNTTAPVRLLEFTSMYAHTQLRMHKHNLAHVHTHTHTHTSGSDKLAYDS